MEHTTKKNTLLKLFFSTLYISAFTFGGGFVIITFMKKKFVDELHWINDKEMLDLAAIAQSSPGAIAVNAAILVGYRIAGLAGMVTATLGTIIPPMLIISIISYFYTAFASNIYIALLLKGMQAGVVAVIFDVVCGLGSDVLKSHRILYDLILICTFTATAVFHVNVIYMILATAFIGLCCGLWEHRRRKSS